MPLNKVQLASDLEGVFAAGQGGAKTQAIADAIDAFVKSGTVTTTVTGTCPTGAVTGTGTGSIS